MYVYSPTLDLTRLIFYTFFPPVAELVGILIVAFLSDEKSAQLLATMAELQCLPPE